MSPNPVTSAATWTLAIVVDVLAVVVAAGFLLYDHHCTVGAALCPAPGQVVRRDVVVLVALGVVLLAVALLALLRGRLLLVVVQLAVLVVAGYMAYRAVPHAYDQLRNDVHLGTAAAGVLVSPR